MNSNQIPNNVFLMFAVRNPNTGAFDVKKTIKNFEEHFQEFVKSQSAIHPVILNELKAHGILGGKSLISYSMHALNMSPTKENTDRIQNAIEDLKGKGIITHQTTAGGHTRGKGAGYVLVNKEAKPATPAS